LKHKWIFHNKEHCLGFFVWKLFAQLLKIDRIGVEGGEKIALMGPSCSDLQCTNWILKKHEDE